MTLPGAAILLIVDNPHSPCLRSPRYRSPDMPSIDLSKRAAAPVQALEMLREHSLATLAQQELERRILGGEIAAGAKLNEVDVATALGVSRGPVREAFRALSQAGLVRVEKNRGVFVREISLDEASEYYEVRAVLEGLIGRLAARRIALDEIELLRALVRRMQAHTRTPGRARSAEDYFALNVEFHEVLARAARNNALLEHYRSLVKQLDLYRRTTLQRGARHIPRSTQEHEAIVEAIAARDEARAEQLLTDHVLGSRARLQEALQAGAAAR